MSAAAFPLTSRDASSHAPPLTCSNASSIASSDASPVPFSRAASTPPATAVRSGSTVASSLPSPTSQAVSSLQRIHRQLWRADQLGNVTVAAHPSHFPELDNQLPGGGWPLGMVTELIARNPGVGELRLLIPMLRQLTLERKVVIMLAPPLIPYAPALAGFGIDLNYLIIIQAPNAADRLWAVEQTLKSTSFGALLAWLPQDRTRPEHLRRMQLAAQSSRGPVFLFRELAAQFDSSPAPLRLLLLPRPEQRLAVQLLKRRGPLLADPILIQLPQPPLALGLRMGRPAAADRMQRQPMQGIHAHMESTSILS